MDYEKAYKEALKRAKKLYEQGTITESLSNVFPELKESEDERIRKELINRINGLWENDAAIWPSTLEEKNKYIAWLEKQGEQKVSTVDWKPSDEQMKLLEELVEDNNQRHFYTLLKSLYEELKRLKEE